MLNVNVINAKNTRKVEVKPGQAINVMVDANTRFELVDSESGKAPTQIKARRAGDNLEIVVDEKAQLEDEASSNAQAPDLVLENYYKQEDVSLFAGEGEQAVSYVPVDGAASSSYAAMNTSATTGAAVAALPLLSPWTAALAGLAVAGGGGGGGSSTTPVTNKVPVAKDDAKSVSENGRLEGAVPSATDSDGTVVRYELVGKMADSDGILIFNSNGTYKFYPSSFDYLAEGEKATVAFKYVAVDNNGAKSDPKTVTIVVTGTNDSPEIVAIDTAVKYDNLSIALTETNEGVSASSTVTVRDKDISEAITYRPEATKVTFDGTTFVNISPDNSKDIENFVLPLLKVEKSPGKFVNDPHNLVWTFSYTNEEAPFFDLIPEGETLMLNYTIEINDPHGAVATKVVSVAINGTDDAPKVFVREGDNDSATIISLTEDLKGSLTILDADIKPDVMAYVSDIKIDNSSMDHDKFVQYFELLLIGAESTFETVSENHNYDWVFKTENALSQGLTTGLDAGEHKLTYSLIFKGTYDEGFSQDINISFTVPEVNSLFTV